MSHVVFSHSFFDLNSIQDDPLNTSDSCGLQVNVPYENEGWTIRFRWVGLNDLLCNFTEYDLVGSAKSTPKQRPDSKGSLRWKVCENITISHVSFQSVLFRRAIEAEG